MKVRSIRVKNYKGFSDSGEIPLGRTCTVIVGQNNAGKTAFLETFAIGQVTDRPHREPQTGMYPHIPIPGFRVTYAVTVSGGELEYLITRDGGKVTIPMEQNLPAEKRAPEVRARDFFANPEIAFKLTNSPNHGWNTEVHPSHQLFSPSVPQIRLAVTRAPTSATLNFVLENTAENLPGSVAKWLQQSCYVFRAERLNIAEADISPSPELLPDASNLPSCLLHLPSNRAAHHRYIECVRAIFPTIFSVGANPISASRARATVTMNYQAGEAPSAGVEVALSDCGTGVSQVLALLYVAITAPGPRIIVIDEPNSFLHPGAAKKLLTILRGFEHQYIISTHSPEIMRILDPEYAHLIEWNGLSTIFRTMDSTNVADQRRLLAALGVKLSDVFGSDNVLWVEGPTEVVCFPLLMSDQKIISPATSIVPIVATGDLEAKNKPRVALVWELYSQLSAGSALIPPALGFSLDRESRNEREMEDLLRQSGGIVKFLPRATYENYLLDAQAISVILTDEIGHSVSPDQVAQWLSLHASRREYEEESAWLAKINGAKLLAELFTDLSGSTVEYRKTTHSVELTKWLLANKPDALSELLAYVKALFASATA